MLHLLLVCYISFPAFGYVAISKSSGNALNFSTLSQFVTIGSNNGIPWISFREERVLNSGWAVAKQISVNYFNSVSNNFGQLA